MDKTPSDKNYVILCGYIPRFIIIMNILFRLFSCQDKQNFPLPVLTHKSLSETFSNDDFPTETWIRKTEEIHCQFDYKLGELLGEGAGGKVYFAEAFHPETKGFVGKIALKVISKSKIEQHRNYKKYLILEKRVQSEIKSNFVIKFIESFQSKSNCFIAFEFASGGTVSSLVRTKRRKSIEDNLEECVRFIAACVLLGLKSIHGSNFVYRDLKPANLLIIDNGYVKLSDFGLSQEIADGEIINGSKAGTLPYFAPEMALKLGHNKLVDLWSYGIFIYEMFTKGTPFTDMEINSKHFYQICEGAETNRRFVHPLIPDAAEDLIVKILKCNKDERLGAKNLDDIKNHEFFNGFDWDALEKHQMASPLLSIIKSFPNLTIQTRKNSSPQLDRSKYDNVSTFTTEGSPVKRRKI